MTRLLRRVLKSLRDRLQRLPMAAAAALGLVGVLVVVAGGMAAYRTYDYVQHDNDFCVSCHLMEDPSDRFAASIHRDLGCKACHQPTTLERTQMGLRQFVSSPTEITIHAEVPNERCEACHLEGEGEVWIQVADSRGHELHLNSLEPILRDLECVVCHSGSVHEFRATPEGCTQRGCHTDAEVRLGSMSHLEIGCEACHEFRAPLESEPGADDPASLSPTDEQCLTCHPMRENLVRTEFGADPHQGRCGWCHNAHTQREVAEAVGSCADVLCHDVPQIVEDDHHRWPSIRLDDCRQCHEPHTFAVDGENCSACHDDIGAGATDRATPTAAALDLPASPSTKTDEWTGVLGFYGIGAPPVAALATPVAAALRVVQSRSFDHDRHRSVECRGCHTTGTSIVRNDAGWCSSCHHNNRPESACVRCHDREGPVGLSFLMTMELPGGPESRDLAFPHGGHVSKSCSDCHGSPPGPIQPDFTCATCHDDHHTGETVDCMQCHSPPPGWAHLEPLVHRSCSGGVCHSNFSAGEPSNWRRPVCVACHEEYREGELPPIPGLAPRDTAWIPLKSSSGGSGGLEPVGR